MKKENTLRFFALVMSMSAACTVFAANVDVQILSATVKDKKIANATLTLQKNGEQSITAITDAQGQASLNAPFADSADALLIVKTSGYSNLVVKCPCAGMTYAISPVMTNLDGMRIVLNWGATPKDLDSHIVYPDNHIYFSSMKGADAQLDVDDTTSYGPETITLERKHDGERYVYAVHDYTNRENPGLFLSKSSAKVFVYVGQTLIRTYYVPTNQVGNLWTVFAITEGGELQDFNTIKIVNSHERLQTAEFQGIINTSSVQHLTSDATSQTSAKTLNTKGELAYQAKKYDEAISFFQAAIELNGNYGQAYSNLGLTFQKAGRVAEALWANRKAIALASGNTAATVRASSHYNNGRIYEAAGQWGDALREYNYAKQQKNNPVYDTAIQRMMEKGAQ
ncbi:MAG: tetratricopeptide repeat protein [Cellvibrio sp.]|uniref:tetratricopeptide repeat protein n=1 Tax=Cellvibrio sp. TaxID=1965322 RepID=UPI0027260761|nr:tetratricopeptide repeat protein [Cellvibrio sp.]